MKMRLKRRENYVGIKIELSTNCKIRNNAVSSNEYHGILVQDSNCEITGNTISHNRRSGISIYSSSGSIINNTLISNDWKGIYTYLAFNFTIKDNQLSLNDESNILLEASTNSFVVNNLFYANNFIGNYWNAYDDAFGNKWNNSLIGNFWDNYYSIDSDNNGIGDSPYIFSEGIIDNYPLMEPYYGVVIPEFPSWILLPLFVTFSIVALSLRKRFHSKET